MSARRQFRIEKSTEEAFDFQVEFVIRDPNAPPYEWVSAEVTAVNDADDTTDETANVIDSARTITADNLIGFGVKGGVSGGVYVIKVAGTQADGQVRSVWGTLVVNDPLS
jgi:hypothetical protein